MFAEEEARLLIAEAPGADELSAMVARRVGGEPLEQIVGWAEFRGLRVGVEPGVFVPRLRTELLVQEAIELPEARGPAERAGSAAPPVIVDMCCGSGAVGAAMLAALDLAELYATDVDPTAIACARRNLEGSEARVLEGDLFEPLPDELRGRVDLLLVNAPYVPSAEIELMPREARLHEHRVALDGGPDGLELQRRVAAEAAEWLAPGGRLLIETSEAQLADSLELITGAGLEARATRSEGLDATLAVGGRPLTSTVSGRRRASRAADPRETR